MAANQQSSPLTKSPDKISGHGASLVGNASCVPAL